MDETFVTSLAVGLPDELLRLKYAGFLEEFKKKAAYHLYRDDLPDIVKRRILLEAHNLETIRTEYQLDESDLIEGIQKYIPNFTQADFDKLASDVDYIFVDGKKKYFNASISSLFITSKTLRDWPGSTYPKDDDRDVKFSRDLMRKNGKAKVSNDIEFTCTVKKEWAQGSRLFVHLPYPSPQGLGMGPIRFVSSSGACEIAPEEAPQRTAAFRADGSEQNAFSVRLQADFSLSYMTYAQIVKAGQEVTDEEEQKLERAIKDSDLAEKSPHYVFSPFIKALSEKIVGATVDKTEIAKKIYDYITRRYQYAYVREYALIDQLPEYFALRGRGDCGLQASLLITLCRYNGIPARWQSGIVTDGEGGAHDWAAVYFRGVGFRPVDPSFGGGALRRGREEDNAFYFGNVDPYRLIFNTDIQEAFQPAKNHYRTDPYDNQYGEAETSSDMLRRPDQVSFRRIIHKQIIE